MRIVQARVLSYGGSLERPLANSQHAWPERRGLLLELEDDLGRWGYGEASPLPGYSLDDESSCRTALEGATWDRELPDEPCEAIAAVRCFTRQMLEIPAARCALETALLDVLGQRLCVPLWRLLARNAGLEATSARLPLAALIHADDADAAGRESYALLQRGYATVKLKVGRGDLEQDRIRVASVLATLGERGRLRLDANRAWSPVLAREALDLLRDPRIEYVEEPVTQGCWAKLGSVPVELAADETLQSTVASPSLSELRRSGVGVIVLKPMALGLLRALDLAVEARQIGLRVVVSHLLDGPVAWAAAAGLALALGDNGLAHGLAPHAGLTVWPATCPLAIDGLELAATTAPGLGLDESRILRAQQ